MNKQRLREIMSDQKEVFNQTKNLIKRNVELDSFIKTELVVIITGIRRCGKSSLLYLIKEKMALEDRDYCYFNFDDERIIDEKDILEQIYALHIEIYGNEPILFFDEIQNIRNWEKFVNRMYESGRKIFVTGSNAKLLSSEISTSLTGRNRVLELFPFSFAEYLRFVGHSYTLDALSVRQKALLQKEFNTYMEFGGLPLVVKEQDLELINSYFQDILYRDIISRYKLSQINEIKQIALYFASNSGKIFSYSTLQKITGIKSLSSIKNYLDYYEQSYLFCYLKKFDYSVKKQQMNPKKVYVIDTAFSNRLGFHFSENRGRILENIVFVELLRRKKSAYYYSGKQECDFLIKDGLHVSEAIQVVWTLDKQNLDREYGGLREAMECYELKKGLIITAGTEIPEDINDDSIRIMPIWEWLMMSQ